MVGYSIGVTHLDRNVVCWSLATVRGSASFDSNQLAPAELPVCFTHYILSGLIAKMASEDHSLAISNEPDSRVRRIVRKRAERYHQAHHDAAVGR